MIRESNPERRKTRTMEISPWIRGLFIAAATSTLLSLPTILWHAHKSMESIDAGMNANADAMKRMAAAYDIQVRQNVALQLQVHRLTDAVNDLRHEKGWVPIEQQTIIGAAPTEAWNGFGAVPTERSALRVQLVPAR